MAMPPAGSSEKSGLGLASHATRSFLPSGVNVIMSGWLHGRNSAIFLMASSLPSLGGSTLNISTKPVSQSRSPSELTASRSPFAVTLLPLPKSVTATPFLGCTGSVRSSDSIFFMPATTNSDFACGIYAEISAVSIAVVESGCNTLPNCTGFAFKTALASFFLAKQKPAPRSKLKKMAIDFFMTTPK